MTSTGGVGISLGPLGLSLETAGVNPLRPLAELGRWVLDMLKLNEYCEMDGETIKREAHKLGLLDELDSLTSKAKALDVDH